MLPTPPTWYRQEDQAATRRLLEQRIASIESKMAVLEKIRTGTGVPEGVIVAPVGTLYLRSDGSTSTTLYVKTSGSGNTGWTAK